VQDTILEGDSIIIYRALLGLGLSPSSVDSLILGMQELCGEFRRVSFSHIHHQGNRSAHLLAKYAKGIVDSSTWMEENSCFLEQTLLHHVISFGSMQ